MLIVLKKGNVVKKVSSSKKAEQLISKGYSVHNADAADNYAEDGDTLLEGVNDTSTDGMPNESRADADDTLNDEQSNVKPATKGSKSKTT